MEEVGVRGVEEEEEEEEEEEGLRGKGNGRVVDFGRSREMSLAASIAWGVRVVQTCEAVGSRMKMAFHGREKLAILVGSFLGASTGRRPR